MYRYIAYIGGGFYYQKFKVYPPKIGTSIENEDELLFISLSYLLCLSYLIDALLAVMPLASIVIYMPDGFVP